MPPMAPAQNSQQAQQNLQGFTSHMQTPDQAAAAANNQFNVQGQQQQVQGLRTALQNTTSLLNNVAPSVMGRTANSLVTSAQATRQIAGEQAPIQQNLATDSQAYGNAQSDYQNALGQAESLANANLGYQDKQQSYLQGIYNDLYTKESQANALAEQKREADMAARNSGSGGANPSFATGTKGGSGGLAASHNPAGGYSFTSGGQPITMAQYLYQGGLTDPRSMALKAANMLAQGTAADKKAGGYISQYVNGRSQLTSDDLAKMARAYPQIFGGDF